LDDNDRIDWMIVLFWCVLHRDVAKPASREALQRCMAGADRFAGGAEQVTPVTRPKKIACAPVTHDLNDCKLIALLIHRYGMPIALMARAHR
jgi:hypothetical protein